MSTAKTILGIVPGLQATALVAANIPDNFDLKPSKKKQKNGTKKMVGLGVKNIVGIGLIGATASMVNKMS